MSVHEYIMDTIVDVEIPFYGRVGEYAVAMEYCLESGRFDILLVYGKEGRTDYETLKLFVLNVTKEGEITAGYE